MVNFDNPPAIYWSNKLKLEYLQRQIIVHSILYYEMHESIIEDFQFDSLCKQYMELELQTNNNKLRSTQYWYVFEDFMGETGCYIYDRLNSKDKEYLCLIANHVLKLYNKGFKS